LHEEAKKVIDAKAKRVKVFITAFFIKANLKVYIQNGSGGSLVAYAFVLIHILQKNGSIECFVNGKHYKKRNNKKIGNGFKPKIPTHNKTETKRKLQHQPAHKNENKNRLTQTAGAVITKAHVVKKIKQHAYPCNGIEGFKKIHETQYRKNNNQVISNLQFFF